MSRSAIFAAESGRAAPGPIAAIVGQENVGSVLEGDGSLMAEIMGASTVRTDGSVGGRFLPGRSHQAVSSTPTSAGTPRNAPRYGAGLMTRSVPRTFRRAPEGATFNVSGPARTLNSAAGRTSAEPVVATDPATTASTQALGRRLCSGCGSLAGEPRIRSARQVRECQSQAQHRGDRTPAWCTEACTRDRKDAATR